MMFVRFLHADDICQEMLYALKLATDTTGESIIKKSWAYFVENSIPLENVVACATDSTASMARKYREFNACLKKAVPEVVCIHCVVHWHHLDGCQKPGTMSARGTKECYQCCQFHKKKSTARLPLPALV